jgi:hypothetical protein
MVKGSYGGTSGEFEAEYIVRKKNLPVGITAESPWYIPNRSIEMTTRKSSEIYDPICPTSANVLSRNVIPAIPPCPPPDPAHVLE